MINCAIYCRNFIPCQTHNHRIRENQKNKPGDEVVEWNGQIMCNKSAQEVQAVIADSRYDTQVELIMSRMITTDSRRAAQMSWRQYQLQSRYRQTGISHNRHYY